MSNSFNKAAQILKKPKICLPPLPIPPPAAGITCGFDPATLEGPFLDLITTECFARNVTLPPTSTVAMSQITDWDLPLDTTEVLNDGLLAVFAVRFLQVPGIYLARYKFAFSDGSACVADVEVIIVDS